MTAEKDRTYDSNNNRNYIDNSAVSVANGVLTLKSYTAANANGGTDYIGADLRSRGNVEFGYGYVEIKAKLPTGNHNNAALWLPGTRTDDKPYASEVDVFETLGWGDSIVPDVHLWYTSGNAKLPDWITDDGKGHYDLSDLSRKKVTGINEYHIYGCEWTPTTITLYLDGVSYATYDLTKANFNALANGDPLSLALSNVYYNPNSSSTIKYEGDYVIDYVRLYQKQDGTLSGSAVK